MTTLNPIAKLKQDIAHARRLLEENRERVSAMRFAVLVDSRVELESEELIAREYARIAIWYRLIRDLKLQLVLLEATGNGRPLSPPTVKPAGSPR